jgi:hypothetical protein
MIVKRNGNVWNIDLQSWDEFMDLQSFFKVMASIDTASIPHFRLQQKAKKPGKAKKS